MIDPYSLPVRLADVFNVVHQSTPPSADADAALRMAARAIAWELYGADDDGRLLFLDTANLSGLFGATLEDELRQLADHS